MGKPAKIICSCGGELRRPLPVHCPHCGAAIAGVRRPLLALVWPLVVVGLLFASLVGYLWWLLNG